MRRGPAVGAAAGRRRSSPSRLARVHARSALFDLYGDHLRPRGDVAPVAALVRLLAPLGVAPPAVRTAVSRMVRQGWLSPVRVAGEAGYGLTPRAIRRLDEAASRIYHTSEQRWDGAWQLLVTGPGETGRDRAGRDRLRAGLTYLGYAQLSDSTWIAPRRSPELDSLLEAEGVRAELFAASYEGDGAGLLRRAWDLDGLARAYVRWLDDATRLVETAELKPAGPGRRTDVTRSRDDEAGYLHNGNGPPDDEAAFAARFRLVHEWRKFLFRDPGLPRVLLPTDWPGGKARDYFDAQAGRLWPAATRYVDCCLGTATTLALDPGVASPAER